MMLNTLLATAQFNIKLIFGVVFALGIFLGGLYQIWMASHRDTWLLGLALSLIGFGLFIGACIYLKH